MKNIKQFFTIFFFASLLTGMGYFNYGLKLFASLFLATLAKIFPEPKSYDPTRCVASFNIQTADTREIYRTAAHLIAEANGLMKPNPKGSGMVPDISKLDLTQLTQGYICTMCDIKPQTQQLQFSMVDTQQVSGSPVIPPMRLLSMQDSFVVGSMSYFLFPYFFTGNQNTPNFGAGSLMTPITYVSSFPDNQPLSASFMDAGTSLFWNPGTFISIEVDKKVVVPYWDCLKHMYVPQTQATMAPSGVLTPTQWPLFSDQYDGSTDGYYPVDPTIIFGGGRQNIVKLNLPANVPSTIPPFNLAGYGDSFILKAALVFHGILAQNSTSVK